MTLWLTITLFTIVTILDCGSHLFSINITRRASPTTVQVQSLYGRVFINVRHMVESESYGLNVKPIEAATAWSFDVHRHQPAWSPPGRTGWWEHGGFAFSRGSGTYGQAMNQLSFPWWLLFFLTALPLAVRGWRWHNRAKPGHCVECGYNLNATLKRCPECGREADVRQEAIPDASSQAPQRRRG